MFRNMFQGQGQDQYQGQGQVQDHLQLQRRAAPPHLLMVLALTLVLGGPTAKFSIFLGIL